MTRGSYVPLLVRTRAQTRADAKHGVGATSVGATSAKRGTSPSSLDEIIRSAVNEAVAIVTKEEKRNRHGKVKYKLTRYHRPAANVDDVDDVDDVDKTKAEDVAVAKVANVADTTTTTTVVSTAATPFFLAALPGYEHDVYGIVIDGQPWRIGEYRYYKPVPGEKAAAGFRLCDGLGTFLANVEISPDENHLIVDGQMLITKEDYLNFIQLTVCDDCNHVITADKGNGVCQCGNTRGNRHYVTGE